MNKGRVFGYFFGSVIRHSNVERNVVSQGLLRNYSSSVVRQHAATSLYRKMCLEGIPVSSTTLNILMNCFSLEGKFDSCFSLLGAFFKRGIVPDSTTFNALLRGLLRANRMYDAMELSYRIIYNEQQLCQPNVVLLWLVNVEVFEFFMATKTEFKYHDGHLGYYEACSLVRDIEYGGADEAFFYDTKFTIRGHAGYWNEVQRLWNEVLSCYKEPHLMFYASLLGSFAVHGLMKDPAHVFKTRCTTTYDRLIHICQDRRIFDTVVANGLVPGISTFNVILEGLLQSGRCDAAREFFSEVQPNFDTYSIMLDGLCKNGLDNEALQLLERMERDGVELPMTMYSIVLDELRRRGIFSSVSLKRMRVKSCSGRGYEAIVSGLCEHGLLEEAKVLFVRMECLHDPVSDTVEKRILQGLVEGGKYGDAVAYIDKMVGREFGLDSSDMSRVLEVIVEMEDDLAYPFQKMVSIPSVKATKATSTRLYFCRWLHRLRSYSWRREEPWIQWLERGLEESHEGGDPRKVVSDASMALEYLERELVKPYMELAVCLQLLGSACCRIQRFDESLGYLKRAGEILGQLEEEGGCSGDDMKHALHGLHSEMFALKKAVEVEEANGDRDVAEAYLGALDFKQAKHYCLKALEMHSDDSPVEMARDRRLVAVIESGYELDRDAGRCTFFWDIQGDALMAGRDIVANNLGAGTQKLRKVVSRTNKDSEEMVYALIFVAMARAVLGKEAEEFGEAKRWLGMAADLVTKNQLTWPLVAVETYEDLSVVYESMDDFEAAISMLERARGLVAKAPDLETNSCCTGEELDARIGGLLVCAGKHGEAVAMLEKTAARMQQVFKEEGDYRLGYAYNNLGAAYMRLRMAASAARALARAKDVLCAASTFGPHHPRSIDSFLNLSEAHAAMDDYEGAMKWQEEAIEGLEWRYDEWCLKYIAEEEDEEDVAGQFGVAEVKALLSETGEGGDDEMDLTLAKAKEAKQMLERGKLRLEQLRSHPPSSIHLHPPIHVFRLPAD